jgi:hypothetical protein
MFDGLAELGVPVNRHLLPKILQRVPAKVHEKLEKLQVANGGGVLEGVHDATSNYSGDAKFYVSAGVITTGDGDMHDGVTGVRAIDQYSSRARDFFVLSSHSDAFSAFPIAEGVCGFRKISRVSDNCTVEGRVTNATVVTNAGCFGMLVEQVSALGGPIPEVAEGDPCPPMPMSAVFDGSVVTPVAPVLPVPTFHELDGEDKQFAEPLFDWNSPFPEGIEVVSLPGWTIGLGDKMHYVVTQFRHLQKSYRSFQAFVDEVTALLAREEAELESLKRAAPAGVLTSGSPLRVTAPRRPAWCRGGSRSSTQAASECTSENVAEESLRIPKKPFVFAETRNPCDEWGETIDELHRTLFPVKVAAKRKRKSDNERTKGPVSKKSPCWPLFSKTAMLVRSQRVVLKWAWQVMNFCRETIHGVPLGFALPHHGFEPHNDWLKSHRNYHWMREYYPFLRQFLFEELPYRLDPLAHCYSDYKACVGDRVKLGVFVKDDDWETARMSMLRGLAEFGLDEVGRWDHFKTYVGAIARFSTEVFIPTHTELQGGPYPFQSGAKLIRLDLAATLVLKIYDSMSTCERCVCPEAAVRLYALRMRYYHVQYRDASLVARAQICMSPLLQQQVRRAENAIGRRAVPFWADFPYTREQFQHWRDGDCLLAIHHMFSLENRLDGEEWSMRPMPWAMLHPGLDLGVVEMELRSLFLDPWGEGPSEVGVVGELIECREEFKTLCSSKARWFHHEDSARWHRRFAMGIAHRWPTLWASAMSIAGVTGCQPRVEQFISRLWRQISVFRRGLRTPLLEGILMVTSWRFGVEVLYEILSEMVAARRESFESPGADGLSDDEARLDGALADVDGSSVAEDMGLSSEFGEYLRNDYGIMLLSDQCGLRDEAADAFFDVWRCTAVEYRRVLSNAPRPFVRAVAASSVAQMHVGSSAMQISEGLGDAWEASMRSLDREGMHPCLFYMNVFRLFSHDFQVQGEVVGCNWEELLLMPLMRDSNRECFTWAAFKTIGDIVLPATEKAQSMIDAWHILTRLSLPELAWDLVFPKFAFLVHPDLDASPEPIDPRPE